MRIFIGGRHVASAANSEVATAISGFKLKRHYLQPVIVRVRVVGDKGDDKNNAPYMVLLGRSE